MKKIILLIGAVVSLTSAMAQTSSGSMMLGGGVSFHSESREGNNDYQNSSISFMPSFGYFVADRFAVGVDLSISSSTNDNGASKTVNTEFGFGPFARYYVFTSNEKFAFFGQAAFMFYSGNSDFTPGGEQKYGAVEFSLSPGFAYFFNNHWALNLAFTGLRYQTYDPDKDNNDDKISSFDFGVNSLNPTIGVRYHFGGQ